MAFDEIVGLLIHEELHCFCKSRGRETKLRETKLRETKLRETKLRETKPGGDQPRGDQTQRPFMSIELMNVDFFDCILQDMSPFDKYTLAATCTQIRVILYELFESWDMEIAKGIASHVDADHTSRSFHMKVFDSGVHHSYLSAYSWPTTKMEEEPLMILQYKNNRGCYAYEHGDMGKIDATYRLDPIEDPTVDKIHGEKKIFYAHPIISYAVFGKLKTLKNVPVDTISWEIHPEKNEPGTGYFYGEPVVDEEQAVYIRTHNVVSADVSTVNPRIKLELMGVSMLDRAHYKETHQVRDGRAHINMGQLRLYIKKAVMSSTMRARSHKSTLAWQCRTCTLSNMRSAAKCLACKKGKRPAGIVKRHRS
jgi:hypothetical protein